MNWYYALDGRQTGPVSETQLDELVRSGKINRDTPVWHEGMADWQRLHEVRAAGPPPLPGSPSGVVCVECGRTFPPGEVIKLNQSWVCAQCKPFFLQRLSEGAAPSGVGIWRQGRRLVTRSETPFPDRCVKCNAPANGFRLKRVLYWVHPACYLLLLCNLLILLIVYLIVRKKAILHIGLCEKHRVQRKMGLAVGWAGALVGIALLIGAAAFQSGWVWRRCCSAASTGASGHQPWPPRENHQGKRRLGQGRPSGFPRAIARVARTVTGKGGYLHWPD